MHKFKITLYFLFILFSSIVLFASPINLTERDMFVRIGFDKKWTTSLPDENNKAWQKFPANKDDRPVRVRQLKFNEIPKFRHFNLEKYPNMTFTYVTSFDLKRELIEADPLGLFLAQIGLNWEVYINGYLLKSEIHLAKDGSIKVERAVRSEKIPLNYHQLKQGKNILAFKIVGNPVDNRTGLYMKKGYIIDSLKNLKSFKNYLLPLALISIYIFFGLYHIFLFIIRSKEKYNLVYGLFAIVVATYSICRLELIFSLFSNTYTIKTVEMISLTFFPLLWIILLELLGRNRLTIIAKIWTIYTLILVVAIIFIWRETLLRISQLIGILGFLYAIIYAVLVPFGKIILNNIRLFKESKNHKINFIIPRVFMQSLLFSIPGNIIIGIIVFFITGVLDVIQGNAGNVTQYSILGFAFFLLGIAGILANRFVQVHNRVEELNISLEEKVEQRTLELFESEKKYRTFIDEATDIIFKCDCNGNFKFMNSNGLKKIGYSTNEICKINYTDLITQDYKDKVINFYREQLKNRFDQTFFEFPFVSKSGEVFWGWQNVKAIKDNDGNIVEFDCIVRDITDKKKTEEALEEAIIELDIAKEQAERANLNKSKFLAYISHELRTPLNSINGIADLLQFGSYEKDDEIISGIDSAMKELKKVSAKYKKEIDIENVISELEIIKDHFNQDGNFKRYTFSRIINKLKKAGIKESHESFEKISSLVDTEEKEIFSAYRRIKDSGDYLLGLINNILNLSKVESGKIEITKSDVNINEMIESIVIDSKNYAKSKNKDSLITIKTFIDEEVPDTLHTDKEKLRQVLLNLCSNAIKFTENGEVKISVTKSDNFIKFSVTDNGVGISDDEKEKIFMEFHRLEGSKEIEGTGLGLVLSKKLVELQGGQMEFESEFGKKSTFWFELPC